MVGVDKKQRLVKMRHLLNLGTNTVYINLSVYAAKY